MGTGKCDNACASNGDTGCACGKSNTICDGTFKCKDVMASTGECLSTVLNIEATATETTNGYIVLNLVVAWLIV
jgi:hypothetical protein